MARFDFTNGELWDALRAKYPSFASMTAKATKELFSSSGWGELTTSNPAAINEFFELSVRVALNKLDIADVNTRLDASGLVERYATPMGGILQRISVETPSPISPRFLDLENGQSRDPWVVRKPQTKERFFKVGNFAYQALTTIQQHQAQQIFIEERGMSAFLAGIQTAMARAYKAQKEVNIYRAIHEALNSATKPLKETQKIVLASWTASNPTDNELLDFVAQVQDLATEMEVSITQPGFNANGFDTHVGPADHVLLVRAGIMGAIKRKLRLGAFNPEDLALPFEILEVGDFGGVEYRVDISETPTPVYPRVDVMGAQIKGEWTTNPDGTSDGLTIDPDDVYSVDTDAAVLAVVAQKGVIFTDEPFAYTVRSTGLNPAGLYENFWASQQAATIRYDANYNLVKISRP